MLANRWPGVLLPRSTPGDSMSPFVIRDEIYFFVQDMHIFKPDRNRQSRLAVNAVTLGNFDEPIRISIFVKDLFAGFSMVGRSADQIQRLYLTCRLSWTWKMIHFDGDSIVSSTTSKRLRKVCNPGFAACCRVLTKVWLQSRLRRISSKTCCSTDKWAGNCNVLMFSQMRPKFTRIVSVDCSSTFDFLCQVWNYWLSVKDRLR